MKATGLVSPQMESGISSYVGFIGLPCLLFRVTSTLDMSNIRPTLVFSLLLAKVPRRHRLSHVFSRAAAVRPGSITRTLHTGDDARAGWQPGTAADKAER